ncbi:MAG: pyridoxal phosphate-dependent aminotransferase [Bacteroidia bacterium]
MKGTKRLQILSESQTLALTKLVRQLQAEGKDVVGLTLGEPDFDTPDHIRDAAIAAIREGFTHYTPVAGILPLRAAIARDYDQVAPGHYQAANVVVSNGAKQSVVNVVMSLVDPGEEVIIPCPYWVSYIEIFKMAEAKVVEVPTTIENGYKMTAAQLEAAITPNTKMLLINSPNNPTGGMYTLEEAAELVAVLERHPHVVLVSDEIYEHIWFEHPTVCFARFESIRDRLVIISGVSKGFAMTGWRIGYTLSPQWIAELCEKYQGQITSGASSISQKAALAAYTSSMEPSEKMRLEFKARRDFMGARLAAIPGLKSYNPPGAFYFYPDLSAFIGKTTPKGEVIRDIDHLTEYLLMEGGVAVIPGTAFGTDRHVRISYAYAMEYLEKGCDRMAQALTALK